ncbi:MAG: radical SAM protein, partial [Candidatus Thermoplasmatota archaeon]
MHLPVAPSCNIACRFCGIEANKTEKRPGAYSEVLTPISALDKIRTILKKYDYITTIGVAGPGDPLANVETFETLKLVSEEFPSLMRCICTNGLALPESIKLLKNVNLTALTVTVNAINPEIGSQIIDYVCYKGEKIRGEKGSSIL